MTESEIDILNILNSFKEFTNEYPDNLDMGIDNTCDKEICESSEKKCESCGNKRFSYDDGCDFCTNCGLLCHANITQEAEYRNYGYADNRSSDPSRVGMPINNLLQESSLGTIISRKGYESSNFNRMRQFHTWHAMPYKERSLWRVYERLTERATNKGINQIIIEDAKQMYKILSEHKISRGGNRNGLIASCIYIACRKQGYPRSAKEIADVYAISVNDMTRGCKRFCDIMYNAGIKRNYDIKPSNPIVYVNRFCSMCQLSQDIVHLCEYVTVKALNLDIGEEHCSSSIAAGSIYLIIELCKLDVSKKLVANSCFTSEVTITKCYKLLYEYRHTIIPKQALEKYNITL